MISALLLVFLLHSNKKNHNHNKYNDVYLIYNLYEQQIIRLTLHRI